MKKDLYIQIGWDPCIDCRTFIDTKPASENLIIESDGRIWQTACNHYGGGEYIGKEKAENLLAGWEKFRWNQEKKEEIEKRLKQIFA